MHRFYGSIKKDGLYMEEGAVHHIVDVLRMKVGDMFELVDSKNNKVNLVKISKIYPYFDIEIVSSIDDDSELPNRVVLFYCLAKGAKMDFVVQKATELGVKEIVFVSTSRCVYKFGDQAAVTKKFNRFSTIAHEASKQSHRISCPTISGIYTIKDIKDKMCTYNYVAYEEEKNNPSLTFDFKKSLKKDESIGILIGPEGGFSKEEIKAFNDLGFKNVSLGKRILRTETAAITALSVIDYLLENE